jgi:hypothetical protein
MAADRPRPWPAFLTQLFHRTRRGCILDTDCINRPTNELLAGSRTCPVGAAVSLRIPADVAGVVSLQFQPIARAAGCSGVRWIPGPCGASEAPPLYRSARAESRRHPDSYCFIGKDANDVAADFFSRGRTLPLKVTESRRRSRPAGASSLTSRHRPAISGH